MLKEIENPTNLKDLGEFALIRRFTPLFSANIPPGVEGIGNDCAVIPRNERTSFLVTTDLLIENTHFIKNQISAVDLAFKALSVNLSDIAAMGGKPCYAFLSMALPVDTPVKWIDSFMSSFAKLAERENLLLLGGDTTRSTLITINVLIIGEAETAYIKRRSQAVPGDVICCTGNLGDSGGGLKILLEQLPQNRVAKELIETHFRPHPQLAEGALVSKAARPSCHDGYFRWTRFRYPSHDGRVFLRRSYSSGEIADLRQFETGIPAIRLGS